MVCMRHDSAIELHRSGTLTRRHMVTAFASVGVGVVASSFMSGLVAAGKINKNNGNRMVPATRMVAAIFFESYSTIALRRALRYAGDSGFVASMPQLLHARVNASYDNIIWNTWFTANSEESVVTTPLGNHVVVTVHGGGIFATPARIERSLRADLSRSNSEGLTGQYAAKISEIEARDVLDGTLPDGSKIAVFQFDEFKRGIADLPRRYAVVLDFEVARQSTNGYERFDALIDDPLMIVRTGGLEPLAAYLDKARDRHNTKLMGNWHPYNRIDPDQPQTRILELAGNKGGRGSEGNHLGVGWGYDADYGITGNGGMVDMARYVAVAPRNDSVSLRYLDFGS